MGYLLSVDGGGTKTEFCISDLDGNSIGTYVSGSSNYKSVGLDQVYLNIRDGIRQIEEVIGIFSNDIVYSVWGISGCDSDHDREILADQIIRLGIPRERFYLCNDGILAFYAQASEPGLVIISGTGSIILGIDENGRIERAGGWGYNISDIGSGYWIGNEALKRTLLYCDGCIPYSPLFEKIRDFFHAKDFLELPYIITEVTDYFEIAKVALLVVELSAQKEITAGEILEEGVEVLAALVKSTCDRLGFCCESKFSIVFSGGVLKSDEYQDLLKIALKKYISLEHISFFTQKNAPVLGGIKLAKQILDRVK